VRGGVVTTSEPNAARVGAEILRRGGNAIDAAAAVQFALNVVEPQSSGIGGGGFMLVYLAKEKKLFAVESREKAPAAATPDMFVPFLAYDGRVFPLASTSGLAVGVPGTLLGVATALENWGTISLTEALSPAIELAEKGFRVGPSLAQSSESARLQNEPGNPAYDEARKVFRPNDAPLVEGRLLVQPDLAKTLKLISTQGLDAFYDKNGEIANAIIDTQLATRSDPATGVAIEAGVGRMTLADLENYNMVIRDPVEGDYRGLTIKSMGPPSSGALTVIQILKLIERFPIGDEDKGYGFGDTRTLNVMIEAMRLAFADRAVWMGDEDFVDVPAEGLLNDHYVAMRSALIDPDSRLPNVAADDPRRFDKAALKTEVKLASISPEITKGVNTTHFTIIDREGNIVSYTTTIESGWGTGLMVPGYGFLLNNELTDFNFNPAYNPDPDNFNPGANDVAPGKRPRSSMSPVLVFHGDKPLAAYGSPGGSTIIDSVVGVTVNLIDHGMAIQEAVDAPRIAQTSANGSVRREIGFSEAVMRELEALGHSWRNPADIGSVQAVVIDRGGKPQYGAADRRRVGAIVTLSEDEIANRGKGGNKTNN
jgi:gamma-glutamyltranspeptidase/glutathione hydrolase